MGNYVDASDISSWPSGCDTDCKNKIIDFAEQLIEKITGTHFYEKAFNIEINGNNKNRIFPPLHANILSVSAIYVCGYELDPTWYGFDESSVYLDLCKSGVALSEYYYVLSQEAEEGIFPRGYNNIRIVGTYGYSIVPEPIKKAASYLIDAINEGSFSTVGMFESEKIGDYSYKIGIEGYSKKGIYTGIPKVDIILRAYMKQKKPIIQTP
ncbi:MAG: hypothetical protein ACTSPB_26240 [Candidatus Thorarchaeota archaeon]